MLRGAKLAEGKTKIIWQDDEHPGEVLVESKDDITAGNGAKHDLLPGKAEMATQTTCNIFELLERAGLPTHYIGRVAGEPRTFRARSVRMLPVEIVAHRRALGSYLQRYPKVPAGAHLGGLLLECFGKAATDPLLEHDYARQMVRRYDAYRPFSPDSLIGETPMAESPFRLTPSQFARMGSLAVSAFGVIETAWQREGVEVADLKLEFGLVDNGPSSAPTPDEPDGGRLVIADVVDNDSWRLWINGDPRRALDKQLYRDDRPLPEVGAAYALVAAATDRFATIGNK